jgi:radical SAM protein with 4Fe4S-binding SPASM domain
LTSDGRSAASQTDAPPPVSRESEEDLLERNPAFCMAPWMHLHVLAEGHVTPCCESRQQLGNINTQSFDEIWNGAAMAAVRGQMLRGERVTGCQKCYDREDSGVASPRQSYNENRRHLFDRVVDSRVDGRAPHAEPVTWDIRFSNICNFRCRSCWHGSSSRWFADGVAIGVTAGDQAIIHGVEDADALFVQLDSFLPHLEEVYFAGGEPLMMEEHYRLLDLLIERGRVDVALSYNTNLSVLSYKERDVLELWNRFSKVKVAASIDASGARGELMRKEQNWRETVENARRVRAGCPHVQFSTETTVSIFNILHLPALFRELGALDFVSVERMGMHILQDPPFYNIRILPRRWKAKVRTTLVALEEWFAEHLPATPEGAAALAMRRGRLAEIVSYMDSEDWSNLLPRFRETTARLDGLRTEATRNVFPELAQLLDGSQERRGAFGRLLWRRLWALLRQH